MSFFLTFLIGFFVQFALSLFYDHPPRNSSLTFSLWGHSSVSWIFAIPLHHRYIYVIPQYYSSFSFFFVIPHWLFLGFFLCYSSLSFLFFLSLCHSSFFVIFLCHSSLLFLVVLFLCYSSSSFLIFLSLCHSSLYSTSFWTFPSWFPYFAVSPFVLLVTHEMPWLIALKEKKSAQIGHSMNICWLGGVQDIHHWNVNDIWLSLHPINKYLLKF